MNTFEIFEMWANGYLLETRTIDYHAVNAIQRFKQFQANKLREKAAGTDDGANGVKDKLIY